MMVVFVSLSVFVRSVDMIIGIFIRLKVFWFLRLYLIYYYLKDLYASIIRASQAKVENPRNKICAVVFDISKAFDKVWHNGL